MLRIRKLLGLFVLVFLLTSCTLLEDVIVYEASPEAGGELEVHFIDVGQGDAIYIKTPTGENLLIDAGGNADGDEVVAYLENQNVKSLQAVIGTHPHEDHIGGLDRVIDHFEVEKVYMPKVVHDTKTFEDVLKAIKNKGLKISTASLGVEIPLKEVSAVFLGPVFEKYEELNDYSAVLRVQYKNNVFLFTGDAETQAEQEILRSNPTGLLKADVLKVGHHGSTTSTSDAFLEAVDPADAVIMAGKDNKYGHPHREIVKNLEKKGISLWRTDQQGHILMKSDGDEIQIMKGE